MRNAKDLRPPRFAHGLMHSNDLLFVYYIFLLHYYIIYFSNVKQNMLHDNVVIAQRRMLYFSAKCVNLSRANEYEAGLD